MFRKIGIVLSILLFIWFFLPYITANILNIGNITGMGAALLLMLYLIFQKSIHAWFQILWCKQSTKSFLCVIGGLIVTIVILVIIETGCMISSCMKTPTENATAVVLGCRVYGERASLMLRERLEAAYDYLLEYPDAVCVVSGGQGPGEDISEAECMKRWLIEKGISEDRIYKEDQSTSTEENIAFTKQVIEKHSLNPKIAIVTNEYHIYRATILAEHNDLEYGTVAGHSAWWLFPTYYVRELYAILAEWIF